ncbi:helix-turn-helix transcriptional regulator [Streptomyces sp. NBC_01451]|uniref:helix-turn-helix transcriptional regulator n=1 Tax=Streptomyces sp. NBC_01451 TaxID=2903872 RepID=UPI002E31CA61|nr:LuxR C-terminal-related transcriptional regulator [Streptomyces sp. NBC_01451]
MTVNPPPVSDDDRQLRRAIDSLRHTTGVDLTFGGVVTRGRHAQLTEFAGNSTRALMGLTLGFGMGLGGKAVALHRPIAVNDYANSKRISHHYDLMVAAEGIRAVVAAPVVVNRTVRAVMYGAVRQSVGLGDRTVDAVMDTARALEQNLAVRDEVAHRLGRLDEPGVAADRAPEPASPQWETIREAYAELRVLAQHLTDSDLRDRVAALSDRLADAGAPAARRSTDPVLSSRELDVLSCVALGRTNTDVASELGLRAETVKSYLRSAMRRLGCHSRLEAVMTARRLGLLP